MNKEIINMRLLGVLIVGLLILNNCTQNSNKPNTGSIKISKASEYTKPVESFKVLNGLVLFDTLTGNLTTHKIISGNKNIFIYERTGVTMVDANDWEAKYTESLIFQVDTTIKDFNYCDNDLSNIDCKYYWICLAKEIKKEIRNIDEGCIKGNITKDSVNIEIEVNSKFRFGGILESDNDRIIKYKTTRR
ncbi:MAG: hypothetical protein JW870_07865 [Candidatus Delongbacteria bacterium]|nr:hypothetical protein [Candidatus Delongbacteria bacterium]